MSAKQELPNKRIISGIQLIALFLSHLYIIVIAIAFGISLTSFKTNFQKPLRLLSVLLGLTVVAEFIAVDGFEVLPIKNNMVIYNPFMLIEFCFYAIFFKMIIRLRWFKKMIDWYLILFTFFWLVNVVFIFGINAWVSYVSVVGSLFTIFFAIMYYYQILTETEVHSLTKIPEFWIATGVIIFYAGNLPYTGMLNFLIHNYKNLASQLTYVLKVLNIVMYSLFAYAYLCQPKTSLVNYTQ